MSSGWLARFARFAWFALSLMAVACSNGKVTHGGAGSNAPLLDASVDASTGQHDASTAPHDASHDAALAADTSVLDVDSAAADASADAGPVDSGAHDPGTAGDGDLTVGPTYSKDPDLDDHGASKGMSFQFTMNSADSQLYRGEDTTLNQDNQHPFTRQINVYVPAAYHDGTPAPYLIIHDGPGQLGQVKNALDNLTKETDPMRHLPAFIAIAVANGGGDSKGSERGLEYDTMSDRYARFIHDEVLPAVLARPDIKQAYPQLAFTDDPDGHATLGCSSGGAAAFTMGWFRPEWFRRIITYSGTLVDQQDDDAPEEAMYPLGAWDYHSGKQLIANTMRQHLRVSLHVSEHDLGWDQDEAGHHNWVIANMRTAAALSAKGYHYRFETSLDAGHCEGKVFDQTLAQTLLWAWRGYAE